MVDSPVPVAVDTTGVLAGKTVVSIASGGHHCLALCSDGTVVAWGDDIFGQLGNNSTTNSAVPVAVDTSGVLAGKTVVAIAAGSQHSMALCSDGTIAVWGHNPYGQFGNGTTVDSLVPVAVDRTGVLAGKTVIALAGGADHTVALCSDGSAATWGLNTDGQLGSGYTVTQSTVPVAVGSTLGIAPHFTAIFDGQSANHVLALSVPAPYFAYDFNGDTKPDFLFFKPATGQSGVWYMNGPSLTSIALGPTLPAGWSIIAAADFNGDGKPNYLVYRQDTGYTGVWYMNGPNFVSAALGPTLPAGWVILAAADFNGDGKPDFLVYNPVSGQTAHRLRLLRVDQLRVRRRGPAQHHHDLRRARAVGPARAGQVDHGVRQRGPHLHVRRRDAL